MSSEKHNIQLSKGLSWLLRHNILSQGLTCSPEGYVDVDSVLNLPKFKHYTVAQVQEVVRLNDKQRFALRIDPETGALQIRANQGHTIEHINPDLKPIKDATLFPVVLHGTYMKAWPLIKSTGGLCRMRRNHIHFAPGLPEGTTVISGMRKNCDVHIYVDLARALQDGFEFFESANGVILCPGNEEKGLLPLKYFQKAVQVEKATDLKKSIPGKEVLGLLVYRVRYNVVTKQLVARFSNSLLRSSRSGMMAGVLKSCYIDRQSNFGRGSVEYFAVLFQYILIATLLAS